MWLRDALPYDLQGEHNARPMTRVIIYGYESAVADSNDMRDFADLATSFRKSLSTIVLSGPARPLILIAHSLSGLIIKQVGEIQMY